LYGAGGWANWELRIYGDRRLQLTYFHYAGTKTSTTSLNENEWHCIEVKEFRDAADGEYKVYVNGVEDEDLTVTGLNNAACGDPDTLTFTDNMPRNQDGAWERYFDCVVVSDAYIGPESEAALKTVTDALALSDDACRNKNFVIADTSGLTDAVLQHKTLVANDSVDVNDAVLTDKTVVTADAVNLAGSLIVDKVLQVTETTNLFETVQVGVGGVKKTKLFLIIGDLAVQLTGE
jgi:hypothetical protein